MLYDREISFSLKDGAGYKIAQLKSNDIRAKGDFTYPLGFMEFILMQN